MIARIACSLLLGLGLHWGAWAQGRWHLHPDDRLVWRDVIAHIDNGVVRMGNSWSGEVAYTLQADAMWDETKVFQGFSTSSLDIAFTLRDNNSTWATARSPTQFCTPSAKAKSSLAIPPSPWTSRTPCVRRRAFSTGAGDAPLWGVYKEDSRSWSDRVAVIEGAMDAGAIMALLAAGGWL